jgi:hypothetical protein
MANLSISITADTTLMRAQLALAEAGSRSLRSTSRMRMSRNCGEASVMGPAPMFLTRSW